MILCMILCQSFLTYHKPEGFDDAAIVGSLSGETPQLSAAKPLLHAELAVLSLVTESEDMVTTKAYRQEYRI